MAAESPGLPVWTAGVWGTIWEEDVWDSDSLIPDLAMIRERQRRQAARRDWLVFLRGGR